MVPINGQCSGKGQSVKQQRVSPETSFKQIHPLKMNYAAICDSEYRLASSIYQCLVRQLSVKKNNFVTHGVSREQQAYLDVRTVTRKDPRGSQNMVFDLALGLHVSAAGLFG